MTHLYIAAFVPSLILVAASASAQQVVLDFEDLVGFAPMPAGYGGVADWGSWAHSDTPDPNYPAASGMARVLSVGLQQSIVFGQDVVFEGANVVSAFDFSWGLYYQGTLVHTSAVQSPNTGGPAVWLPSGYSGLVDELRYIATINVHSVDDFTYEVPSISVGMSYCGPAVPNSTGQPGEILATGSDVAAMNDLTLTASNLPANAFGYFLTSQLPGLVVTPNGSLGTLCLGGQIGRYIGAGQIQNTGAAGEISLVLDLVITPTPTGLVPVMAGETWHFQAWHRDSVGGSLESNFTDAVSVVFV